MQSYLKKFLPHFIALLLFIVASLAYFSPVLQGKILFQNDIAQFVGMSKQQSDYSKTHDEETYWTDAAFGGMPTYQSGAKYPNNYIKQLDLAIRILPRPADYLLLYFVGMYILFLTLKVDYKLAIIGALAFGFSTYLIIILGVGHNAKAHAIAYMPFVLSGIFLTFRGKYLYGFLLTTIAMGLELVANHFQMTYYLMFLVIVIGLVYLYDAVKKKILPHYFKSIAIMLAGVLLAVGLNLTNILATKQYADFSTRGKSELTINADGTPKDNNTGLSYDYITEYSYGKLETFNLFIPRFMGGGSSEAFPNNSETVDALVKMGASSQEANDVLRQLPMYWGDQTIVAAPAYIGAVVIFLAVLALFLIRGRLKWWIVIAFILSLLLSWGKNFNFLTELFVDIVPLYNKFRAVSSIQVIIELVLPILAVVGLHKYFTFGSSGNAKEEKDQSNWENSKKKALIYATAIVGGITLLFIVFKGSLFNFASPYDGMIREQMGLQLVDAIREDRMSVFTSDALRSLIFVLATASILFLFLRGKLNRTLSIVCLGILIVLDLVGVDKRYVTNDDFVQARVMEQPFQPTEADKQISQDDGHYRVYDAADPNGPFNSGRSAFFHNTLGGYHAAKPRRMNDLNEFYISKGNLAVMNMMNVRYFIINNKAKGTFPQLNPYANGNAWFVENVIEAKSANEEIKLLDSLDTKKTAIVASEFMNFVPLNKVSRDTTATIDLVNFRPQHLTYETASKTDQLALFSEVYYADGWNAYVNGKPAEYFRADYVLRAMKIPPGNNKIEFKFEPEVIKTGSSVSVISSIILLLILLGSGYYKIKKRKILHAKE